MSRKKIIYVVVMLCGAVALLLHISSVASAKSMDFTVKPEPSANQRDARKSYFDLNVKPDQEQTVTVDVTNTSNQKIKVATTVNTAKTNPNGTVEYSKSRFKNDRTLTYPITKLTKISDAQVELPAKSTKKVTITVTGPAKRFNGVIAGGITFKKVDETKSRQAEGVTINNQYQYVVGLILHQGKQKTTPQLKLGQVKAQTEAARNNVTAQIRNVKPRYLSQAKVIAKVQNDQRKNLYKSTRDHVQFAPNAVMDYQVPLNGDKFKPGRYRLVMTVTAGKHTWHFNKWFTITSHEAEKYNRKDLTLKPDHTVLYLSVCLGLIVIIGVLGWIIVRLRHQK